MPISPKVSWEETVSSLTVNVHIAGLSKGKADVFATEALLKVNAPPYLFHVDLYRDVEDERSVATISADKVTFWLQKKEPSIWGKLEADSLEEEVNKRRKLSIEKAHKKIQHEHQAKLEQKKKWEKDATDRQIDLDSRKRRAIEKRKEDELAAERDELAKWQSNLTAPGKQGVACNVDEEDDEEEDEPEAVLPDHPDYYGRGWKAGSKTFESDDEDADENRPVQEQPSTSGAGSEEVSADVWKDSEAAEPFKPLPPPRQPLEVVSVEMTPTENEHLPARAPREEEIRKHKKQMKDADIVADSHGIAERHPAYLKDRADEMFHAGNYAAAVNAYSRALQLDGGQALCFANRAACRLKMHEYSECLEDCAAALKLLPDLESPDVALPQGEAELAKLRRTVARLHARSAAALAELSELPEAAVHLEQALKFDPEDEGLRRDLEELEASLRPADAAELRRRGDARFAAQDVDGAAEAYSILLGMPQLTAGDRLAARANRAACHLKCGRYDAAIDDVTAALGALLEGTGAAVEEVGRWVEAIAAASGTDDSSAGSPGAEWGCGGSKRSSLCRLLARRGACYGHLRRYGEAQNDYASLLLLHRGEGNLERAALVEADLAKMAGLAGNSVDAHKK